MQEKGDWEAWGGVFRKWVLTGLAGGAAAVSPGLAVDSESSCSRPPEDTRLPLGSASSS